MSTMDGLASIYSDQSERDRITRLYALSVLFRRGIRVPEFEPSPRLTGAIELSPHGKRVLSVVGKKWSQPLATSAHFAAFTVFAHNRLLIELEKTDIDTIADELSGCVAKGLIKYPWIFGHDLYDRAFAFDKVRDELTAEQAADVLGVNPGVCQMHDYLVGPLGLLKSASSRLLPPMRDLPLWHCSNPSCSGIHSAALPQKDAAYRTGLSIEIVLEEEEGVASDWEGFFRGLISGDMDPTMTIFVRLTFPGS